MHSFHHDRSGITFHHNGDYSGDVRVVIPSTVGYHSVDDHGVLEVELPADALVAFSHHATIQQVIGAIEQLSPPAY